MNAKNKKNLLLKIGQEFFASQGFTNVGLAEILKQANIPKGSFYYYFNSKEDYGVQVIDHYIYNYIMALQSLLKSSSLSGKDRLLKYWEKWQFSQCDNNFEGHCLIVKLSSEVTDYSEPMRKAFCRGTDRILSLIAQIIAIGQKDNSIHNQADNFFIAQQLYQQWLGASLMVKIQKRSTAFTIALHFTNFLLDNNI